MLESRLNSESRVNLVDQDGKVQNKNCNLNWQLHEQDQSTFTSALKFAQRYTKEKIGNELEFYHDPENAKLSEIISNDHGHFGHHMSTLKIHSVNSPGAVDVNLRLIGTNNVYITSPALFPAVGFANPTLMNMALAIHLAEQLEKIEAIQ